MTAAQLAQALGGRKDGRGWKARCPAHDDRNPSLSIGETADGKVLVKCFAGCDQARLIAALQDRGLWPTRNRQQNPRWRQATNDRRVGNEAARTSQARAIWSQSIPATGTLVEVYLRTRGVCMVPPQTVRFHTGLKHPSGDIWPAMVSLVTRGTDNEPLAIHRTFLLPDGSGKAPVDPQKMMFGPCRGGAVMLGPVQPGEWLAIAEGIETTLSVMQACALPGWAALSASGIKSLVLPCEASMVLICADNDATGSGQLAAQAAGERFLREGRRVRIAVPSVPDTDFNEVLNSDDLIHVGHEVRHVA